MRVTLIDLRTCVLAARVEGGQSVGMIAQRFGFPSSAAPDVFERYRDAGIMVPESQNAGRKQVFSDRLLHRLLCDVVACPDVVTLTRPRERIEVSVSSVRICSALKKRGFTRKSSPYVQTNNGVRTWSCRARRGNWQGKVLQRMLLRDRFGA